MINGIISGLIACLLLSGITKKKQIPGGSSGEQIIRSALMTRDDCEEKSVGRRMMGEICVRRKIEIR